MLSNGHSMILACCSQTPLEALLKVMINGSLRTFVRLVSLISSLFSFLILGKFRTTFIIELSPLWTLILGKLGWSSYAWEEERKPNVER